ncbi:MAG: hypothetical protein QF415_16360 [Candidatus Undinarchaeales archaeon]|jgi:hypothetical protein|nr:hypothetical protein [Candidatus Undinarchaeales archaeon]
MEPLILGVIVLSALFLVWLVLDSLSLTVRDFLSETNNVIKIMLIAGVVLGAAGYLKETNQLTGIPGEIDQLYTLGAGLLLVSVVWVGYRAINRKFKKKRALEIEEARREYIRRVRKGLTVQDAENLAQNYIKKRVSDGRLNPYKSIREVKTWHIYFEGKKNKYKVIVDADGEITDWATLTEEDIFAQI